MARFIAWAVVLATAAVASLLILVRVTSYESREERLARTVDRPVEIDSTTNDDIYLVVRDIEPIPGTTLGRVLLQHERDTTRFFVAIVGYGGPPFLSYRQRVRLALVDYIADNAGFFSRVVTLLPVRSVNP